MDGKEDEEIDFTDLFDEEYFDDGTQEYYDSGNQTSKHIYFINGFIVKRNL